jgi:uncharacterized membrane protein
VSTAGALPLRRRADRQLLRWEARLETETGDRYVPLSVAVVLGTLLATAGLARLEDLSAGTDIAGYTQALWLLGEGYRPEVTVFGGNHILELHWSLVLYLLVPLSVLLDTARLLVVVQAIALGLAVLPLWRLARSVCRLRVGAATVLVLAYGLHPATWTLGTVDFHPEALAVPALITVLYAGAARRWVLYWVAVAVVLACRADLGLAVAGHGVVLLSDGERRAGLWSLGVGSFWSLSLLLVVQPLVGDAEFAGGQYASYGGSLAEVVSTMFRNPELVLSDLAAEDNLDLIVGLLAPVIFLPLLAVRYVLAAVPLLALYMVADAAGPSAVAERSALLLAVVMVASTFALKRMGDVGVDRVFVDGRIQAAVLLASALLFLTQSPTSPYREPWSWSATDADRAVLEAVELLGPEVAVRASPSALVPLAERPWLYQLRPERPLTAPAASAQARAVLLVEDDNPVRDDEHREQLTTGLSQLGYEVHFGPRDGVTLFLRP